MSLLPQQILPPNAPFGTVEFADDKRLPVQIEHNWWLFLYNLALNTLGTGATSGGSAAGLPSSALTELSAADADAADTDATVLRQSIGNLSAQVLSDFVVNPDDLPDIGRALLLAQEPLPQDSQPFAQPLAAISPTGSPFSYVAPFDGTAVVTGGSVSAIAIVRQGTSIATGLIVGVFPLSRLDTLVVTYSSAPTMTFLPR